ncbi:hypothetical protein N7519_008701 [Penicillium mononematosum]|uniref:uncharacterized protein n=1 Tax=Penicillium mononematosum TaxID=268346 RepID=UPI0025492CE7|nr:uncharacterized protein N7519_008701 [Penicillium mononematosum]KAJ6178240.1 hypothetical protein N7519_008701 [Penicillium mononematosum]
MVSTTTPTTYVDKDALRTRFAAAMSSMYRSEVPLYSDLIDIVHDANERMLSSVNAKAQPSDATGIKANIERLTQERHGAIRLGTPYELRTIKRIFEVLGMHPIGYYDLSIAGLPMHATCFRPLTVSSLNSNPFRVFTTLLRPELLASEEARRLSLKLLEKRNIFSDLLLNILDVAEMQGGRLKEEQTEAFIQEALSTFSWQSVAAATIDQYQVLKAEHPILADIACFQSAHINHLTPRTLDISAVHLAMKKAGMAAKDAIEGPPARECPILLRQTSFLALEEAVRFRQNESQSIALGSQKAMIEARHKARFGEIEERGAAVTPKGRELYDRLLRESKRLSAGATAIQAAVIATKVFKEFPDTWRELRLQGLIYCEFYVKQAATMSSLDLDLKDGPILEQLISMNAVEALPITYEDFLPFSAAGIFQSNLQTGNSSKSASQYSLGVSQSVADPKGLEKAMDAKISDLDAWYSAVQTKSLEDVGKSLGFTLGELMPNNV